MLNTQIIEEKLSAIKPYLNQEFHVDKIGYFGSFAKGGAHENSDIDILIYLNQSKSLGWKFFDLKAYLETIFKKKIDLVTENSLREKWREQILKEVKFV